MKKGWIIYRKNDAQQNKAYIEWFIEEAFKQNMSLELVLRENITIGIRDNKQSVFVHNEPAYLPTFAIVRTIESLLNLHLETLGVQVFNSSIISNICNNKALTHHKVSSLQVPMVDTIFTHKSDVFESPPLPFPFVLKETSGRGGKQVHYIKDTKDWQRSLALITTSDIIIQSCNVKLGKDVRVFVVGNEIIGAVLRESTNDFRANFKLGGTAKLYHLLPTEEMLVNKIITHFDFGMVGIDFLIDHSGNFLFNEIEDIVGSRTLSAVSNSNIVQKYVTHIKNNI
ncbi:RimK family alpha-L-glutamate ligase [Virgibacillus byunsanensis]|uniref:RimK family alpha-L-glutamate ligase n=1 Tax=Virgibacillus byunsanensis TaxID=570945 RepID=A0ABW3LMC2_9BACI